MLRTSSRVGRVGDDPREDVTRCHHEDATRKKFPWDLNFKALAAVVGEEKSSALRFTDFKSREIAAIMSYRLIAALMLIIRLNSPESNVTVGPTAGRSVLQRRPAVQQFKNKRA